MKFLIVFLCLAFVAACLAYPQSHDWQPLEVEHDERAEIEKAIDNLLRSNGANPDREEFITTILHHIGSQDIRK